MDNKKTFKDLMHLANLLIFFYMVTSEAVCSPIQHENVQSQGPIYVIKNTSFTCEEVPEEYQKYRFVPLTNENMKSMLDSMGGSFIKSYMATDEEQAKKNFKNLLISSSPIQDLQTGKTKTVDVHTVNHITKENLLELIRNEGEETVPSTDKKEERMRKPRATNSDGIIGAEKEEFCLYRGTPTQSDSEYLYTCTMCAVTRTLPKTYWPRVLNEVTCKEGDEHCFYDDISHNGNCEERTTNFEILKKIPNACELALQNGETIIVEQWEIWLEKIRVGCECYINAHSPFAEYL